MVEFYRKRYRDAKVVSITASNPGPSPNFKSNCADFHKYLVIDGRRISASGSLAHAPSSIMQLDLHASRYVGEVFSNISHQQAKIEDMTTLLEVHWFKKSTEADTSIWDPLYVSF